MIIIFSKINYYFLLYFNLCLPQYFKISVFYRNALEIIQIILFINIILVFFNTIIFMYLFIIILFITIILINLINVFKFIHVNIFQIYLYN